MDPGVPYRTQSPATLKLMKDSISEFYRLPVGNFNKAEKTTKVRCVFRKILCGGNFVHNLAFMVYLFDRTTKQSVFGTFHD